MAGRIEPEGIKGTPQISIKGQISKQKQTKGVKDIHPTILPKAKREPQIKSFDTKELSQAITARFKKVKNLEKAAQKDPFKAPSLHKWTEKNANLLLEAAIEKQNALKNFGKFTEGVLLIPEASIETSEKYIERPLRKYIIPLVEVGELVHKICDGIADAGLVFELANGLGQGAALIYKKTVLKMLEKEIAKRPSTDELEILKAWVNEQNTLLLKESKHFGIEMFSYLPHGIEACADFFGGLGEKLEFANVGLIALTTVAANTYRLHRSQKKLKTHREWMQKLKEKPIVDEPIRITEKGTKIPKEMPEKIHTLLDRRKKNFENEKKRNQREFDQFCSTVVAESKTFEEINQKFKDKGIDLNTLKEPIVDKEDLIKLLSDPKQVKLKSEMLKKYVDHKETVRVMTRNGLKSLINKKHSLIQRFLRFKRNKKGFSLGLSILYFTAVVTLKALLLAAVISIPAMLFSFAGLGFMFLGIGVFLVGLLMLRRKKPHLFSELVKGVKLKLALYEIPYAFNEMRLNIYRMKKLRIEADANLSAKISELKGLLAQRKVQSVKEIPKNLRPYLKKLEANVQKRLLDNQYDDSLIDELTKMEEKNALKKEKKLKTLSKKIESVERNLQKWQDRIAPLRARMLNAGWKDFEKKARFATTDKREPFDLEKVLMDGIFVDENLLDEQTKSLLEEQLLVDLKKLREKDPKEIESVKKDVRQAIKSFFSMDDSLMLKYIKKQKREFDFANIGAK